MRKAHCPERSPNQVWGGSNLDGFALGVLTHNFRISIAVALMAAVLATAHVVAIAGAAATVAGLGLDSVAVGVQIDTAERDWGTGLCLTPGGNSDPLGRYLSALARRPVPWTADLLLPVARRL